MYYPRENMQITKEQKSRLLQMLGPMAVEQVFQTEDHLEQAGARWQTLAPDEGPASCLSQILLKLPLKSEIPSHWLDSLCRYALSIQQHFPGNIFCDLEALAAETLQMATGPSTNKPFDPWPLLENLNTIYGTNSPIRFSYTHDFLYGWDWVKWLRRQGLNATTHGPFCLEFLNHLVVRAKEITELIAESSAEFPPVVPPAFRNPFSYFRDPQEERHLLRILTRKDQIPLRAWRCDSARIPDSVCDTDWQKIRQELAQKLGHLKTR